MGLAFLTIAMGGMQIMLDKGEENDWFASSFIRFFAFLFVGGIIGLFVWEWRQKNPLINLRLFRFKNFAICCFLMMLVGGVLNANTVLQPQFLQQLLGYNATNAGLALTAGGFALVIMMPLAGYATGKVSARTLAVAGFTLFVITFRIAADVTTLEMSFAQASWLRVVQMLPLAVLFHFDHQCSVCRHAQGREQPGGRAHQFRAQPGRQHPDRADQRAGDQPRHVASAASADRHGSRAQSRTSSI